MSDAALTRGSTGRACSQSANDRLGSLPMHAHTEASQKHEPESLTEDKSPEVHDEAPVAGSASAQDGSASAPSHMGCWPALALFRSAPQARTEEPEQLLDIVQIEQRPLPILYVGAASGADGQEHEPTAAGQAAATASAEAQPLHTSAAPDLGPWPALHLLDSNCEFGSDAVSEAPRLSGTGLQQSAGDVGLAIPAGSAAASDPDLRGGYMWDTGLDDLIMEEQEVQQQQQQQQQQQPPTPPARLLQEDGGGDDEIGDLLMDEQELLHTYQQINQQQQQQQQPARPDVCVDAGNIADLTVELDELDGTCRARQQQHSRVAGALVGAIDAELDFGAELDGLFEQPAAACPAATQAPVVTALKPATLQSLGTGAAAVAARHTAAVVPPQQLASAVQGPSLTVTGSTGQRVYCQLDEARPQGEGHAGAAGAAGAMRAGSTWSSLLAHPIEVLLDTLAERRKQEVLAEFEAANAMAAELQQMVAEAEEEQEQEPAALDQQQKAQQHAEQQQQQQQLLPVQSQLWVDKYAPCSFLSLLSEPRVNREVAAWMARWNKQKQQHQAGIDKPSSSLNGKQPARQQQHVQQRGQGHGNRSGPAGDRGLPQKQQQGGRGPGSSGIAKGFDAARYQAAREARAAAKVLLVVGPPGTGKTTLAHVVAKHCGFRVVEINASDERTASSLTRRIKDVAQMQPVIDGTRRPPCIVLDELDGAAAGSEAHSAVAALVKLVTGDGSNKRGKKCASKKSAACLNTGLGIPIIATANDAYAPALRPLRDIAGIYHFKPPGPEKLMARLEAIAAVEGLAVDRQALHLLVERSGCDVRTCINTLQLLARQAASSGYSSTSQGKPRVRITARAVCSSAAFGVKDVSSTPLAVLNELLTGNSKAMAARLQQLAASAAPSSDRSSGSMPAAIAARLQQQEHYSMLLDLAEHEVVQCGLHEALPDAVGLDVDMSNTLAAAEALAEADRLLAGSTAAASASGRGMFQYVPACLMRAARLLRREQNGLAGSSSVPWPRAQAQCAAVAAGNRALLRSWRARAPAAAARQLGCGSACLLELAPALAGLSRPGGVKAVSRQLLSTQQTAVLDHVAGCLVCYGCTYSFPSDDEEQQTLSPPYAAAPGQPLPRPAPLSPEIDSLHCYSCLNSNSAHFKTAVPLVVRQMLCQSISTAAITRLEQARHHGEAAVAGSMLGKQQAAQGPGRKPSLPLHHTAAARAAVMPAASSKAGKGCWLDALKARAAPKRKAPAAAPEAVTSKRIATSAAESDKPDGLPGVSSDVLYKFNEGYTNAVKRPMKVQELLD